MLNDHDFYQNVEWDNYSSVDGETIIYPLGWASTDVHKNPNVHWGFKIPSDAVYAEYIEGYEYKDYYYDFITFPPIQIIGMLLTSILGILVIYGGWYVFVNRTNKNIMHYIPLIK